MRHWSDASLCSTIVYCSNHGKHNEDDEAITQSNFGSLLCLWGTFFFTLACLFPPNRQTRSDNVWGVRFESCPKLSVTADELQKPRTKLLTLCWSFIVVSKELHKGASIEFILICCLCAVLHSKTDQQLRVFAFFFIWWEFIYVAGWLVSILATAHGWIFFFICMSRGWLSFPSAHLATCL